jgi:hypothetical protein
MSETFVLIHGSWHGGWAWQAVICNLSAKGHHARHLVSVQWDNGAIDYVYPVEIELLGRGEEPAFNVVEDGLRR